MTNTIDSRAEETAGQRGGRIGQHIGVSKWILMDQQRIDRFADITDDRDPLHIDTEAAAKTRFGGTIAHGYLTLSMLSAMMIDAVPALAGATLEVNYGLNSVRFITPVPSGSRVRGRFVLNDFVERKPGQFQSTYTVTVEIEGLSRSALVAEWVAMTFVTE